MYSIHSADALLKQHVKQHLVVQPPASRDGSNNNIMLLKVVLTTIHCHYNFVVWTFSFQQGMCISDHLHTKVIRTPYDVLMNCTTSTKTSASKSHAVRDHLQSPQLHWAPSASFSSFFTFDVNITTGCKNCNNLHKWSPPSGLVTLLQSTWNVEIHSIRSALLHGHRTIPHSFWNYFKSSHILLAEDESRQWCNEYMSTHEPKNLLTKGL